MKNLRGIIGAIIGAVIGALPWLFVYIYGNYIISVLAVFVAVCANFLYRKFGGEVNKKLPMILSIISVLTIAAMTFFVIPCLLIRKEGYSLNGYTLGLLYNDSKFMAALAQDLFVSIIFAILGIVPVVNNIKREVGLEIKSEANAKKTNENMERMKEIFEKLNALDKESSINYEELKENFKDEDEKAFKQVKSMQIIKKYKGKYYFSEKAYSSLGYRFTVLTLKIFAIVMIFIAVVILITIM